MIYDKIYCGNCVDVMKTFDENCIDLTVTSPPYDNMREYKGYTFDVKKIARQLYRVTKVGGVVIWVVGDQTINGNETSTSVKHKLCFQDVGFKAKTMIYQKAGTSAGRKHYYSDDFEYMFLFAKDDFPKTFHPIMDRENRWAGYSRFGRVSTRLPDGTLKISDKEDNYVIPKFGKRGSVWRYATGHGNTTKDSEIFEHHPAAFPEKLAEDHILSWTNPGDVVLDPLMGSGTSLKMALLNNRRYIGIDVSEEYCQVAENRIAKYRTSRATELPQSP